MLAREDETMAEVEGRDVPSELKCIDTTLLFVDGMG